MSITIQEIIIETTKSCKIISELLMAENDAIRNKQMDIIAENISIKDKMASKIMGLLSRIKQLRANMPADGSLKQYLSQLQASFDEYQIHARKNALLLRSAHESTALFIDAIRQAVRITQPSTATYGNTGAVKDRHDAPATVVCTSV